MRTLLTINVEHIDYDTQACMLRLKGRNVEENQYVKVRSKHFLDFLKFTRNSILDGSLSHLGSRVEQKIHNHKA